jgi:adenylosuccinate synthase
MCKPIYKEFKGWDEIDKDTRCFSDLPENAQEYLRFIEKELQVPVTMVSIGPGRDETIEV